MAKAKRDRQIKVGDKLYRAVSRGDDELPEMVVSEVLKIDSVNTTLSNPNGTTFRERNVRLRSNVIAVRADSFFRGSPWRFTEREAIRDAKSALSDSVRFAVEKLDWLAKEASETRRNLAKRRSNLAKFMAQLKVTRSK